MNNQILKGNWNEVKGKIKNEWGKLTDDELEKVRGNGNELFGFLQKHYGYTKDQVEDKLNHLFNNASDAMDDHANEFMHRLNKQFERFFSEFKNIASRGNAAVSEKVQENPLMSVGLALSAGLIIGYLLSRK